MLEAHTVTLEARSWTPSTVAERRTSVTTKYFNSSARMKPTLAKKMNSTTRSMPSHRLLFAVKARATIGTFSMMIIRYGTQPGKARILVGKNANITSTATLASMTGHRASTRMSSSESVMG
jgi:hypothetical protein